MTSKLHAEITIELEQMGDLFVHYQDLLERASNYEPNIVEVTALASVLHSFYSGVENVFLRIAKRLDGDIPSGQDWHRKLLYRMAEHTERRAPVISEALKDRLAN